MALDPSISLAVRPPQFNIQIPQPLQQYGQVLTLQGLMQEQGLRAIQQQQAQLQLQQQQIEMKERRDYADWLRQKLSPSTTTPGAVITAPPGGTVLAQPQIPVASTPNLDLGLPTTLPVTVPPATALQPASTGGGQIATGFDLSGAPAMTAPAPSLGTMMTTPPVAPVPVSAAPIAPAPAATGGMGGMEDFNIGEVLRRFPNIGPGVAKSYLDTLKSQLEVEKTQHENTAKTAERLGSIAVSIRDSPDPAGAFGPSIYQAIEDKVLPYDVGRQLITEGYDRHKNDIQRFIDQAQDVQKHSETAKNDADSLKTAMANASTLMRDVQNQQDYATKVYPNLDRRVQAMLGPNWTPQLGSVVQNWNVPGAELPKTQMGQIDLASNRLAAAASRGPAALAAALGNETPEIQAIFAGETTPLGIRNRALNPEQYVTAQHQNLQSLLDAERVRIERQKADAEYGPGTAESIAAQIYANPDSVEKMLTPTNRAAVLAAWNAKYRDANGKPLPLPTPLDTKSKDQETAAYNVKRDSDYVRKAMQNPVIANNVGALLGNLQNVEQTLGLATGLTGADAQMAQEFRTRMRFLLANEAGAFYSRVNPATIKDLQSGSPRINMDSKMLLGALDGVDGETNNKIEGFEKQRFSQKMRPPEARGIAPTTTRMKAPDGTIRDVPNSDVEHYKSAGATVVE